jgi:hypothetical protein
MPIRPSPDSTESRYQNGNGKPRILAPGDPIPDSSAPAKSMPSFMAPFLGAFAAVVLIAGLAAAIYFGMGALHSSGGSDKAKDPLQNVAAWQTGNTTAKTLEGTDQTDVDWWTRTFDLPKEGAVTDYLQKQGLTVSRIEPAHYQTTADGTTITYNVYAEVPAQLVHLQQMAWQPIDPDMSRFTHVLVINDGLPPGTMWNTQSPTVAAEAGSKLNFAWQVHWDKNYNVVDTDRLPLSKGVFTQEQVSQYQAAANNTLSQLQSQIQQIDAQVQSDTQAKLAQVPADPPRPELLSSKFGGDGSGEPTKSAERIGGGTLAGAAGGAAFGAAAGDAGMGAGIGAGVGLLGGFIYDTVSKNNDKKRHERAVEAENDERLDEWHSQVKALKRQRSDIQQQALAEKDRELTDLSNRIAANQGRIEGVASAPATPNTPPVPTDSAPPVQPTSDQPSGPIKQP